MKSESENGTIIIINGPLGVGKTETSWELLTRFDKAVMLDGDYLGAVHPFQIYDQERIDYLYDTIHHLAVFHHDHGYRNFVINYVFEEPESLAQLRDRLSELDNRIYAFRLIASPEAREARIRARALPLGSDPGREIARSNELVRIQTENARRGDLGFPLDTTGLTASQAAELIWARLREQVEIVPYDPAWPERYQEAERSIRAALGERALAIYHIGSTAVPGLSAKPIIDILVLVSRLEDATACIAPLQELGYIFIDHPENVARRFFRKGGPLDDIPRTHHLHIVEVGSQEHHDHLDFRDALRANEELRRAYEDLKTSLAAQFEHDRRSYSEMKSGFVREALSEYRAR